jgi:hypothetical protein
MSRTSASPSADSTDGGTGAQLSKRPMLAPHTLMPPVAPQPASMVNPAFALAGLFGSMSSAHIKMTSRGINSVFFCLL